jgi:YgiT-type zinc finger domain-containing protein
VPRQPFILTNRAARFRPKSSLSVSCHQGDGSTDADHGQIRVEAVVVQGTAPFSVDRGGYHLHWDGVPAWVCTQCGEALFEGRDVDVVQEAMKVLDRQNEKLLAARFCDSAFTRP